MELVESTIMYIDRVTQLDSALVVNGNFSVDKGSGAALCVSSKLFINRAVSKMPQNLNVVKDGSTNYGYTGSHKSRAP